MADTPPTVNRIKALEIAEASGARHPGLSQEQRSVLEHAIEQDLDASCQQAAGSEARLAKVEGQMHALADAVLAIAEPSEAVNAAVEAVKGKM